MSDDFCIGFCAGVFLTCVVLVIGFYNNVLIFNP